MLHLINADTLIDELEQNMMDPKEFNSVKQLIIDQTYKPTSGRCIDEMLETLSYNLSYAIVYLELADNTIKNITTVIEAYKAEQEATK